MRSHNLCVRALFFLYLKSSHATTRRKKTEGKYKVIHIYWTILNLNFTFNLNRHYHFNTYISTQIELNTPKRE